MLSWRLSNTMSTSFCLEALEEALQGDEETVHMARPATCLACNGSGAKAGTEIRDSGKCGGSGKLVDTRRKGGVT